MTIYSTNKRARFDYAILETCEAGIELLGFEVKAIRSGRMNLSGSYAVVKNNQLWLLNADIPPYQPKNTSSEYSPKRTRRLLLRKEELKELVGKTHEKGLTLLPLKVYNKDRFIKIEIGLGKHKKKTDKREAIKKRDVEREIRRTLKT